MTVLVVVASLALVLIVVGVWAVKRKLAGIGQHLPGALERWEEEIKNIEKPKG